MKLFSIFLLSFALVNYCGKCEAKEECSKEKTEQMYKCSCKNCPCGDESEDTTEE